VFYLTPLLTTSVNLSLHMTGEEAETFSPGSPQGTIFSIIHACIYWLTSLKEIRRYINPDFTIFWLALRSSSSLFFTMSDPKKTG
jgi:hypothetical protein